MNAEIEDLQVRFAHQELAIETLNDVVAEQGRLLATLRDELERVQAEMRELRPSPLDPGAASEPPPPHY
jgi:SlyX protein